MSQQIDFSTASRTILGPGCFDKGVQVASTLGTRPLVISGRGLMDRHPQIVEKLQRAFHHQNSVPFHEISREPTVEIIRDVLRFAQSEKTDMVLAIGGGSVIDAGKALAALLTNPGEVEDYLEVVGRGQPITRRPLPFVAIPTTAGTGAEVTKNAVLGVPSLGVKVSLRSPLMLPTVAVVDSELTHGMPRDLTIATGLDALTQLLEAFVSRKANVLTDQFCRVGLSKVGSALVRAASAGENENPRAREEMALAAHLSGLALANAGLGAVHGFAGPLGGMIEAPHGILCAVLLKPCTVANMKTIGSLNGRADHVLERYREAFSLLAGREFTDAASGLDWLVDYLAPFELPTLRDLGMREELLKEAVEKSRQASSMKGNPVDLTDEELESILQSSL